MSETIWWGEDSYWSEALDHIEKLRQEDNNLITIDLAEIDNVIFNVDGPAYRLLEAMKSVLEHESYDGYRGAPRLIYALLWQLKQISDRGERCEST